MPRFTRPAAVLAGSVAMLIAGAGAASAHDCYIGTKSLNGPKSANWEFVTVRDAAGFIAEFTPECAAQDEAGMAALKEQNLPYAVKIFLKRTLGEGSANPNLADGKGLERFDAGSMLAVDAVMTYVEAAQGISCA